ncbi:hypothetical protein BJ912DRAFT_1047079 [Pholiota molesta]|nr:hypothetical protein BJ912DRAFT_1047079 [Pholiota molesta]
MWGGHGEGIPTPHVQVSRTRRRKEEAQKRKKEDGGTPTPHGAETPARAGGPCVTSIISVRGARGPGGAHPAGAQARRSRVGIQRAGYGSEHSKKEKEEEEEYEGRERKKDDHRSLLEANPTLREKTARSGSGGLSHQASRTAIARVDYDARCAARRIMSTVRRSAIRWGAGGSSWWDCMDPYVTLMWVKKRKEAYEHGRGWDTGAVASANLRARNFGKDSTICTHDAAGRDMPPASAPSSVVRQDALGGMGIDVSCIPARVRALTRARVRHGEGGLGHNRTGSAQGARSFVEDGARSGVAGWMAVNVVGISHGGVVACAVAGGRRDDAVGARLGGVQCNGRFVVHMEGGGMRRVRYRLLWREVYYVTLGLESRHAHASRYRLPGRLASHSRRMSRLGGDGRWVFEARGEDLRGGERFEDARVRLHRAHPAEACHLCFRIPSQNSALALRLPSNHRCPFAPHPFAGNLPRASHTRGTRNEAAGAASGDPSSENKARSLAGSLVLRVRADDATLTRPRAAEDDGDMIDGWAVFERPRNVDARAAADGCGQDGCGQGRLRFRVSYVISWWMWLLGGMHVLHRRHPHERIGGPAGASSVGAQDVDPALLHGSSRTEYSSTTQMSERLQTQTRERICSYHDSRSRRSSTRPIVLFGDSGRAELAVANVLRGVTCCARTRPRRIGWATSHIRRQGAYIELRRWIGACTSSAASTCLRAGWGVNEFSGRACPRPSLPPHAANPHPRPGIEVPRRPLLRPAQRRVRWHSLCFAGAFVRAVPTSASVDLLSNHRSGPTPCIHSRRWSKVGDVRQWGEARAGGASARCTVAGRWNSGAGGFGWQEVLKRHGYLQSEMRVMVCDGGCTEGAGEDDGREIQRTKPPHFGATHTRYRLSILFSGHAIDLHAQAVDGHPQRKRHYHTDAVGGYSMQGPGTGWSDHLPIVHQDRTHSVCPQGAIAQWFVGVILITVIVRVQSQSQRPRRRSRWIHREGRRGISPSLHDAIIVDHVSAAGLQNGARCSLTEHGTTCPNSEPRREFGVDFPYILSLACLAFTAGLHPSGRPIGWPVMAWIDLRSNEFSPAGSLFAFGVVCVVHPVRIGAGVPSLRLDGQHGRNKHASATRTPASNAAPCLRVPHPWRWRGVRARWGRPLWGGDAGARTGLRACPRGCWGGGRRRGMGLGDQSGVSKRISHRQDLDIAWITTTSDPNRPREQPDLHASLVHAADGAADQTPSRTHFDTTHAYYRLSHTSMDTRSMPVLRQSMDSRRGRDTSIPRRSVAKACKATALGDNAHSVERSSLTAHGTTRVCISSLEKPAVDGEIYPSRTMPSLGRAPAREARIACVPMVLLVAHWHRRAVPVADVPDCTRAVLRDLVRVGRRPWPAVDGQIYILAVQCPLLVACPTADPRREFGVDFRYILSLACLAFTAGLHPSGRPIGWPVMAWIDLRSNEFSPAGSLFGFWRDELSSAVGSDASLPSVLCDCFFRDSSVIKDFFRACIAVTPQTHPATCQHPTETTTRRIIPLLPSTNHYYHSAYMYITNEGCVWTDSMGGTSTPARRAPPPATRRPAFACRIRGDGVGCARVGRGLSGAVMQAHEPGCVRAQEGAGEEGGDEGWGWEIKAEFQKGSRTNSPTLTLAWSIPHLTIRNQTSSKAADGAADQTHLPLTSTQHTRITDYPIPQRTRDRYRCSGSRWTPAEEETLAYRGACKATAMGDNAHCSGSRWTPAEEETLAYRLACKATAMGDNAHCSGSRWTPAEEETLAYRGALSSPAARSQTPSRGVVHGRSAEGVERSSLMAHGTAPREGMHGTVLGLPFASRMYDIASLCGCVRLAMVLARRRWRDLPEPYNALFWTCCVLSWMMGRCLAPLAIMHAEHRKDFCRVSDLVPCANAVMRAVGDVPDPTWMARFRWNSKVLSRSCDYAVMRRMMVFGIFGITGLYHGLRGSRWPSPVAKLFGVRSYIGVDPNAVPWRDFGVEMQCILSLACLASNAGLHPMGWPSGWPMSAVPICGPDVKRAASCACADVGGYGEGVSSTTVLRRGGEGEWRY